VERKDLQTAIQKMLATDGPYIMECAILEEDDVLPMTPPGKSVDEMMLEV
jgi:acetolactate synthase-1/2/3 large subunit